MNAVYFANIRNIVSVPLRGCGFEIKDGFMINEFRGKFPSPCGDVVLKFPLYFV